MLNLNLKRLVKLAKYQRYVGPLATNPTRFPYCFTERVKEDTFWVVLALSMDMVNNPPTGSGEWDAGGIQPSPFALIPSELSDIYHGNKLDNVDHPIFTQPNNVPPLFAGIFVNPTNLFQISNYQPFFLIPPRWSLVGFATVVNTGNWKLRLDLLYAEIARDEAELFFDRKP